MTELAEIHRFLSAVRRRLRVKQAGADGTLALAVGGATALIGLLLAASAGPSPVWRWLSLGLAAAVPVAGLATVIRPLARWRSAEEVARIVDRRARLGDLVLSAVELGRILPALRAAPDAAARSGVSPSLVEALVADAAARCRDLAPRAIVDLRPSGWRAMLLALVAMTYALVLLVAPARLGRGWQVARERPAARPSPPPEPIVGDLELELTPPRYTALPPRTVVGSSGDVLALPGTTVRVRGRALVPATGGELAVEADRPSGAHAAAADADEREPLTVEGPRVAATFKVERAGSYRFALRSAGGSERREAEGHRIELETDAAPRVELKAASDELEVHSARARVELAYTVEDDYGIGAVDLVWQPATGADARPRRVEVRAGPPALRRGAEGVPSEGAGPAASKAAARLRSAGTADLERSGVNPEAPAGPPVGPPTAPDPPAASDTPAPSPHAADRSRAVGGDPVVAAPGDPVVDPAAALPPRRIAGTFTFDLADVDLAPGTRIAYHLEARDNDDVNGPKVGRSRTLYLRVYTPAEKHAEALASQQELVDHAVDLLAHRIDAQTPPRRPRTPAAPATPVAAGAAPPSPPADEPPPLGVEARAALHHETESFVLEVQRVAAALDRDPVAPRDLKPALAEIHDRLARLAHVEEDLVRSAREHEAAAASTPAAPPTSLRPLVEHNARAVAELERDVLLLDDLIGRQRIEQLVAVADEMQRTRDRLRDLLDRYSKSRSDDLKKEIDREIRELQRRLEELAAKAASMRGEVPDEFVNKEALGGGALESCVARVQALFAKGDVDGARAEMERCSRDLDKLASALEGDLRGFRSERFSAEDKALAELESRLADLEHDERQLARETDDVRGRYQAQADKMVKERVQPFVREAQKQVAEMRRKVDAVDPQTLGVGDQDALDRTRRSLDDLGRALAVGDLEEARRAARDSHRGLAGLNFALYDAEQRQWLGTRQAVHKARVDVESAQATAKQLADELERMAPRPSEMMSPTDRQKLEELRGRQRAAERRVEETRRELERRASGGDKGARGAGAMQPALEGLKEAGEHMQRAEGQLGDGEPRGAASEEGQAADRLGQLRQQVQQQRRPRSDGAGASGADEVVKIPGADEYRAPRAFRQDLLDAMKRAAPDQYREQVRRYYEEIAK